MGIAARPADTLTMTLFHAALRLDLARARFLLEAPTSKPPRGGWWPDEQVLPRCWTR